MRKRTIRWLVPLWFVLIGLVPVSGQTEKKEITNPDGKAAEKLLDSLVRLGATPERSKEIRRLAEERLRNVTEEIQKAKSRIQELKARIREIEKRKQALESRLKALPVALELLNEDCKKNDRSEPQSTSPTSLVSRPVGAPSVPVSVTQEFEFHAKVFPILESKCFGCHGPEKQKCGLRLDSREAILKGSEYGSIFDEGNPERSLLIQVITHEHETKMPPKEKLPEEQIDVLRKWVLSGIPWPGS